MPLPTPAALIRVRDLDLWYGPAQALHGVSFDLNRGEILAFMGPSGCGKTTALKCLNRMHEGTRDLALRGQVLFDGVDVNDPALDPTILRRRIGWVAQKPNPFAGSVWHNVAYGAEIHGLCRDHAALAAHVEDCLRRAQLWDEVRDGLHHHDAHELSMGQQQRLCIARALSTRPEVLLMDEPTGSLDPIATARIEDLLIDLRPDHAIVVVTHSIAQAHRIATRVAYFDAGRLMETGPTEQLFSAPRTAEAAGFLGGRFG
ncbi:MAG: phosphate ABC transporter ATP-binding protein [Gemmobacter sp.]